jgi:hypothetical protein
VLNNATEHAFLAQLVLPELVIGVRFKLMFLDCLRLNAATRHQVTAQGNALGKVKPKISPEGRNILCDKAQEDEIIAPFQG